MATPKAQRLADAVTKRDLASVKLLMAPDAVLHHGNSQVLDMRDVEAVKSFEERWKRLASSSEVLASADNDEENTSFVLVCYKDLKDPDAPASDKSPDTRDVLAIWHATWAADGSAIKELVVHSCKPEGTPDDNPDGSKAPPFDPAMFARPSGRGGVDGEAAARVNAAAAAFCDLYDKADPDAVPDVLADDFVEWRPSQGTVKVGRASVQDNLKTHAQYWKATNEARRVAAADASAGFLAWASLGHMAGKDGTFDTSAPPQLFTGLCFIILDSDGLITKSVHPMTSEPKVAPLQWTGF
jgi:ketosteroid isomerase-like protein